MIALQTRRLRPKASFDIVITISWVWFSLGPVEIINRGAVHPVVSTITLLLLINNIVMIIMIMYPLSPSSSWSPPSASTTSSWSSWSCHPPSCTHCHPPPPDHYHLSHQHQQHRHDHYYQQHDHSRQQHHHQTWRSPIQYAGSQWFIDIIFVTWGKIKDQMALLMNVRQTSILTNSASPLPPRLTRSPPVDVWKKKLPQAVCSSSDCLWDLFPNSTN